MAYAYPTSLDADTLTIVIDLLHGKTPDVPTACNAAWGVVGYGLGRAVPLATAQAQSMGALMPKDQLVAHLETARAAMSIQDAPVAQARGILSGLPWGQIVVALLPILEQLLSGLGKTGG